MAIKFSQPMKWGVLAAITGISVFGILTIGPVHEVAAQDRSPIVDVRTTDPEMNAAIARARGTLPTFWAWVASRIRITVFSPNRVGRVETQIGRAHV